MSEGTQRAKVIRALKPLHAVPVENRVGVLGTPDVNYIEGWIELKWRRAWPVKPDTPVTLPHFTIQQRRWLKKRWNAGGNSWLLLQVQREWLLFSGRDAADYLGLLTRKGLYKVVRSRWEGGLNNQELITSLDRDWPDYAGYPWVNGKETEIDRSR